MDHVVTRDGRLRLWTTLRRVTPERTFSFRSEPEQLTEGWPNHIAPNARTQVRPGIFSEIEPGRRLVFDRTEGQGHETRVVVDFEARDSDTLLTVTEGPLAAGEIEPRLAFWTDALGRLKLRLNEHVT